MWRIPPNFSHADPDWYESLDPDGWEGIIELLEQGQDLLCAYQLSTIVCVPFWATLPAVPP